MPRVYFPAHTRRNATRSRCAGSMFAWILNTKPASAGSAGSTVRSRAPRGSVPDERREQLLDAEVVDGGAEEHRRLPTGAVSVRIEALRGALHQLNLLAQGARLITEEVARRTAPQAVDDAVFTDTAALARGVHIDAILGQVVDATQLPTHADGPGDRRGVDAQHALDLIQQLDGRAAIAVELVDEGHDRRVAQAADLHEFDGALLDALGAVDDHQCRVDGGQRAVGVLGEVLVTGRVEQVHHA